MIEQTSIYEPTSTSDITSHFLNPLPPPKEPINLPAKAGGSPLRDSFLVFGKPKIEHDEIAEVVDTLKSGWVGRGNKVEQFESAFAKYKNAQYAIAVNSCTAALFLSLKAIGIRDGDEVITSPITFSATINAIIAAGGTPVFADCDPYSYNLDPSAIKRKLTRKTKAMVPIHFSGRPCDMMSIMDIAQIYQLKVIEDCAHAIEGEFETQACGTMGELGCFSFGATKNIITGGKGGMIISNNDEYADMVRMLSTQGQANGSWEKYKNKICKHSPTIYPGFNFEMIDLQAALGIHQLKRIETYHQRRREIWDKYNHAFQSLPVRIPKPVKEGSKHAMHLYTILLQTEKLRVTRDFILDAFTKENIGVGVHYEAQHLQPYYSRVYGYKKGDFPNAESIAERTISLPIGANLEDEDVNDVIFATKRILNYYKK